MTNRNLEQVEVGAINQGDTIQWESDFYRVDMTLWASDESDRVVLVASDLVLIYDGMDRVTREVAQ